MKLNTDLVVGAKVLHSVPEYLNGVSLSDGDRVLEMGTLSNYKRFMVTHREHKKASHLSSMDDNNEAFSGVETYDDFLNLLENGDKKVMDKIKVETGKQVTELSKKYEDEIVGYKFDVSGQFFDVGLVLSGVPETWLEPEIMEVPKTRVEIIVNGTFSSSVKTDMVIRVASRILAMVRILEDNDVEVKIKIVSAIKGYSSKEGNLFVSTDIKDYDEPINYSKCSSLLSPTYLRRGMFKVMELIAGNSLKGSYGSVITVDNFIDMKDEKGVDSLEKRLFRKGK